MLHGVGDTPAPYAALAEHMNLPDTLVVALAGPLEIPGSGVQDCANIIIDIAMLYGVVVLSLSNV